MNMYDEEKWYEVYKLRSPGKKWLCLASDIEKYDDAVKWVDSYNSEFPRDMVRIIEVRRAPVYGWDGAYTKYKPAKLPEI